SLNIEAEQLSESMGLFHHGGPRLGGQSGGMASVAVSKPKAAKPAVVEAGTSGSWEDAAPQAPERPAPEVRKVAVNERPAPKHAPAPRGGVPTSQGWEEEF
ncbi:MAG: methyl-accepting chemotaxis protein, partial [Sagittula sp.]